MKNVSSAEPQQENLGAALLASPVRRAIMSALEENQQRHESSAEATIGLTAAQLAERLGLHVTTVRFHLDQLDKAGLVAAEFTTIFGVGRPRKVYAAVAAPQPPGRAELNLQLLAGLLAESFGADRTPAQAGEQWVAQNLELEDTGPAQSAGEWLTKVGQLIDVLQDWGYTPNLSTSDAGRSCRIDLVKCPFLELARANPDVVCGIHRGLLAGVLHQLGERDATISLEPFVGPELCHAHVATTHPFRNRSASIEEPS